MMILLVLQRASMSETVSRFRDIVINELRIPWYETLYSRREQHFVKEKRLLAKNVVEDVLPRVVDRILQADSGARLRIVLDSGTTITPLFEELVARGVTNTAREQVSSQVITNNLAGIEVVQKQETGPQRYLTEDNFTLLGGTPLATYRATTGPVTEQALIQLLSEPGFTTIGILTANWLLIGKGHNSLSICAKGRGHLGFKALVAANCEYVFVVAPLGKIFTLDSVEEVDRLMQKYAGSERDVDDHYNRVMFDEQKRSKTFLVTTKRPADSNSPLCVLSAQVFGLPPRSRTNFTVLENPLTYSPSGSRDEVRNIELPHLWTRKCTAILFDEVV
jgi:hypothetical protein